jgi:hypothetical protein
MKIIGLKGLQGDCIDQRMNIAFIPYALASPGLSVGFHSFSRGFRFVNCPT